MTLLKEYLKSQILKLEGTNVQEIQAKSNILVQNYFKISKADLHIKDIPLSAKDITHLVVVQPVLDDKKSLKP